MLILRVFFNYFEKDARCTINKQLIKALLFIANKIHICIILKFIYARGILKKNLLEAKNYNENVSTEIRKFCSNM